MKNHSKKEAELSALGYSHCCRGSECIRTFLSLLEGTGQTSVQWLSSDNPVSWRERKYQPKADVVVAIRGRVVVAVRRAAVLRVVVPATAAIHAVRSL